MRAPSLPRKLYDFFVGRWILTTFILTLSSQWLILIRFAGTDFGLISEDGRMTWLAHAITWPIFVVSLIFALLKSAADKYNEDSKTKGGFILRSLLDAVNAVAADKKGRFDDYVRKNVGRSGLDPFMAITQPRIQIKALLENLRTTLSHIFGIDRSNIGLSIIYRDDIMDHWRWLEQINVDNDLDIDVLVSNAHSTTFQIIQDTATSIFHPDKRVAAADNKYLPSHKDAHHNNIGSILCREINLGNDNKYIRSVLSVSTYGKLLCAEGDGDAINKIENLIIPTFEVRLQLELALLYAKEVLSTRLRKKSPSKKR